MKRPNTGEKSLKLHKKLKGKISITSKTPVRDMKDLSLVYTPGVGAVSSFLAKHKERVGEYTMQGNTVAIVSDGSAVLGLGNIGPEAALPVMEGKALLFKQFANIDAVPIVLNTQDVDEIVSVVRAISPGFAGVNLEDISAPRCFEIEARLKKELPIPVMHDDQHGTAVVILAGLINALKVAKKGMGSIKLVISGAGAAGTALANLLKQAGVGDVLVVDSKGILSKSRKDLSFVKKDLTKKTNKSNISGSLSDALLGADVFVGVSVPNILKAHMVKKMAKDPIIFALSNPVPEIMPDTALLAGAFIVATGRSDFPNQLNNALAFPGIFRGALDHKVENITDEMKLRAAYAIARLVSKPTRTNIVPTIFDKRLVKSISRSII